LTENSPEIRALARRIALINAVSHGGKAEPKAVVGRMMAEQSDLRGRSKLVSRLVNDVVSELNKLSLDEQKSILNAEFSDSFEAEQERKRKQAEKDSERALELPELPDAKMSAVVTRFPPEPNGFMHIGHAKAAIIGSEYAKMYKGKFILRFDDTNPSAEKKEYYQPFLDAFEWLKIKPDLIRNSSDDMDRFYDLAVQMIRNDKAYVCTCTKEEIREKRARSESCKHRSRSVEESLSLWRQMVVKELEKNEATLRFKGDMDALNTTMRDPVLFRIVLEPHPLLGNMYSVWPTYDFAGPVEDSLDGVTHAMRSKEYELRDEQYHAILRSLGLREPTLIEFSRLNLQNTTVHKRTLRPLIAEKLVQGWDDPRLPTISALRRRGFLPESIREFILRMGISKVESQPTWDLLESINRKLLDPVARRYFFVPDPVKLKVSEAPSMEAKLNYHPDRVDYGSRQIELGDTFFVSHSDIRNMEKGSTFRLIEAYNVTISDVHENLVLGDYSGEDRPVEVPKLQWVTEMGSFPLTVEVPGPLLIDDKFNPDSLKMVHGVVEQAAAQLTIGEIVQFVRFGFCRKDSDQLMIRTHS
jgi:glutamyl-tRNA synthetase